MPKTDQNVGAILQIDHSHKRVSFSNVRHYSFNQKAKHILFVLCHSLDAVRLHVPAKSNIVLSLVLIIILSLFLYVVIDLCYSYAISLQHFPSDFCKLRKPSCSLHVQQGL